MFETIFQYAKIYSDPPERVRRGSRALIIREGEILLSYETNTNVYMSPGGGLEAGETLEECCMREIAEETGYEAKVLYPFVTVNEYSFETLYENNYFVCEITGKSPKSLTANEIEHGLVSKWVKIEDALEIFGTYSSKSQDIMSLYLRELTVINKYLKTKQ